MQLKLQLCHFIIIVLPSSKLVWCCCLNFPTCGKCFCLASQNHVVGVVFELDYVEESPYLGITIYVWFLLPIIVHQVAL